MVLFDKEIDFENSPLERPGEAAEGATLPIMLLPVFS